jgi:hypothetical protein
VVAGINLPSVKYFYKKIAEGKIIIKRSGTNYYFTTVPEGILTPSLEVTCVR